MANVVLKQSQCFEHLFVQACLSGTTRQFLQLSGRLAGE